jgi:hypothetical protein
MKAIIIVVIAAIAILGLSYEFTHSQLALSHFAAGVPSHQGDAIDGDAIDGDAIDGDAIDATMRPDNDGVQFQPGHGHEAGVDSYKNRPRVTQDSHPVIVGRAGRINDDLLIMEGRSEDRLALSEAVSGTLPH